MYFPYLRGRQYELLALKELVQKGLLGKSVIPVIEPIKLTSTFDSSLKSFNDAKLPLALILNPAVGDLSKNYNTLKPLYALFGNGSMIISSVLLNNSAESIISSLDKKDVPEDNMLTIFTNRDSLNYYGELFNGINPRYTLCPDERQIRRAISQNKVLFEDKFIKQEKNADYLKCEDEFFSEDHLYFSEEGYVGFGDYSIIGNEYIEGGFAPYAVAFHIVYFDADNILRIRHFISDSNEDTTDVAGKFREALEKYIKWVQEWEKMRPDLFIGDNPPTAAMSVLNSHWTMGTYPGLPTLKKLSIMHHLELIAKYLDRGFKQ